MIFAAALCPGLALADGPMDWWQTPDQQGQRLFEKGEFLAAAEAFEDPAWRGAAYFRGGDFESAASVYGRLRSPEAAYNRGNALVMLGRYEEAIEAYGRALDGRPDWAEAERNREIARVRLERLAPPDDDAGGTGGMLGADELVFDDSGRVNESGSEAVAEGGEMSEEELRSVWLRRVENDPADFLRARFAYQLYRDEQEAADE
jgi:Ca-activated chloride channel family protein